MGNNIQVIIQRVPGWSPPPKPEILNVWEVAEEKADSFLVARGVINTLNNLALKAEEARIGKKYPECAVCHKRNTVYCSVPDGQGGQIVKCTDCVTTDFHDD